MPDVDNPSPRQRMRILLLTVTTLLGLAIVGCAIYVGAHANSAADTAPAAILVLAAFIAVPGVAILATAWRYRRTPRR